MAISRRRRNLKLLRGIEDLLPILKWRTSEAAHRERWGAAVAVRKLAARMAGVRTSKDARPFRSRVRRRR